MGEVLRVSVKHFAERETQYYFKFYKSDKLQQVCSLRRQVNRYKAVRMHQRSNLLRHKQRGFVRG